MASSESVTNNLPHPLTRSITTLLTSLWFMYVNLMADSFVDVQEAWSFSQTWSPSQDEFVLVTFWDLLCYKKSIGNTSVSNKKKVFSIWYQIKNFWNILRLFWPIYDFRRKQEHLICPQIQNQQRRRLLTALEGTHRDKVCSSHRWYRSIHRTTSTLQALVPENAPCHRLQQ